MMVPVFLYIDFATLVQTIIFTIVGCQGIENIDPIELKRRKARERYTSMAPETFSSYPAYINTWYYSIYYNGHFNTLEA
jgi:hypothetical protein